MTQIHLGNLVDGIITGDGLEKFGDRTIQLAGSEAALDIDHFTQIYNDDTTSVDSFVNPFITGTASADSSLPPFFHYFPFAGTYSVSRNGWIGNVINAGWLQTSWSKAIVINKINISAFNNGNSVRSPIDFTVRGSNDGFVADDNILATIVGEPNWSAGEQRTFTFANYTRYKYYRIDITKVQQAGLQPGIGRVESKCISATGSPVYEFPLVTVSAILDGTTPIVTDEEVTGAGNIKYQYRHSGGAYNGSWVTKAAMNIALAGESITSIQIKAQFNAGTTDRVRIHISPTYTEGALQNFFVETNPNDTLRQRIVDVVATRLATITVANGYKTNAGNSVHRWLGFAIGKDLLPAIQYKDTFDNQDQATIGRVDHTLTIDLQLISSRNTDATEDAAEEEIRKIIADLNQMVGTDETWSDLAEDTELIDDELDMEQLENRQWGATISLIIEYRTDRFNSYS